MASVGAAPVIRPLDADMFENAVLRVRVRKPQGWRYIDTLSWSLIWSATKFETGEMSDEELKSFASRPLVVMAPDEVDRTDVHPNMSIWPDPETSPEESLASAHRSCIPGLQRIFRDFELLEGPAGAQLGGADASRLRLRYIAAAHHGVSRQCDVEHYFVKRDQVFVGINFAHATEGHDRTVLDQLREIRESFQFWD
jgi:hypothetical protein